LIRQRLVLRQAAGSLIRTYDHPDRRKRRWKGGTATHTKGGTNSATVISGGKSKKVNKVQVDNIICLEDERMAAMRKSREGRNAPTADDHSLRTLYVKEGGFL